MTGTCWQLKFPSLKIKTFPCRSSQKSNFIRTFDWSSILTHSKFIALANLDESTSMPNESFSSQITSSFSKWKSSEVNSFFRPRELERQTTQFSSGCLFCKRTSENAVKDIGTWHNFCYRCSGVRCRSSAMILVFLMNGQSETRGNALMLLALVIFCASIGSFFIRPLFTETSRSRATSWMPGAIIFHVQQHNEHWFGFSTLQFFHSSIVWHLRRRINPWLKKRQRWYQFPVDACLPPECFNWLICDALIAQASDSGDQRRLVRAENWREAIF